MFYVNVLKLVTSEDFFQWNSICTASTQLHAIVASFRNHHLGIWDGSVLCVTSRRNEVTNVTCGFWCQIKIRWEVPHVTCCQFNSGIFNTGKGERQYGRSLACVGLVPLPCFPTILQSWLWAGKVHKMNTPVHPWGVLTNITTVQTSCKL